MTALAAPAAPAPERARLFAPDAAEPRRRTLEEAVVAAWDELRVRRASTCLVCSATIDSDGACPSCGTQLS